MANTKGKSDVSLVKIDSQLYREAVDIAEANSIDYPSVKNFIEVAVRNYILSLKYNIENRDAVISREGKLIASSTKEFTHCMACDKVFLNDKKRNLEGKRICPRCRAIISKLAEKI